MQVKKWFLQVFLGFWGVKCRFLQVKCRFLQVVFGLKWGKNRVILGFFTKCNEKNMAK